MRVLRLDQGRAVAATRSSVARLSPGRLHAERLRTRAHGLLAIAAMIAVVAGAAALLFGPGVVPAVVGALAVGALLAPRLPASWALRLLGARGLARLGSREIRARLDLLARRAGLPRTPELLVARDATPNALTVTGPDGAAIVLTDGLLDRLGLDEVTAVLAHEVAHVAAGDTRVMQVADVVRRFTRSLAMVGWVLLLFNLPLVAVGASPVPWSALAVLALSPLLSALFQLSLSRAREHAADLTAVHLLGTARPLITALRAIDSRHRGPWSAPFPVRRREAASPWLSSHPVTEERVRRLSALERGAPLGDPLAA